MKLVNKNTTNIKVFGEIVPCNEYGCIAVKTDQGVTWYYRSLAELNEEWEDYEEPKTEFYITAWGDIREYTTEEERFAFKQKLAIGNYFETREEAGESVRKLKAWKRLKDKGFRFEGWDNTDRSTIHNFSLFVVIEDLENINKDLDFLFGGEE